VSALLVACNKVNAQTLESITQQRKLLGGGPQIMVGSAPADIKVNIHTNKIYVANRGSNSVSVIDSNSGNTKSIRVGVEPHAIAVNDRSNKIYVVNERSVSVIDGYNDTKVRDMPYTVGRHPSAIAVDVIDNRIYVANPPYNVSIINGDNDTKMRDIPVYHIEPSAIAVGSDNIYVANERSVSVIDGEHYTKVGEIPVGKTASAIGVGGGIDDPNGKIYVANHDSDTVYVINGHDYTMEHNVPVGSGPSAIGYDENYNKIYVANYDSNTISVIDGYNDNHTNDISVGKEPRAIGVNVITHLIYVANERSDTVSVIHVSEKLVSRQPRVSDKLVSRQPVYTFSYKVASGIIFNINPPNSGKIICNKEVYPTNIYLYVDTGTNCTAQPNKDFGFNTWVESPLLIFNTFRLQVKLQYLQNFYMV
jgi:YVTN family beta-propeller protein